MAVKQRPGEVSTGQAAVLVGASPRQLTYWANRGYIPGLEPSGSGNHLRWAHHHITAARMVKTRFDLARDLVRATPVDQEEGERLTA